MCDPLLAYLHSIPDDMNSYTCCRPHLICIKVIPNQFVISAMIFFHSFRILLDFRHTSNFDKLTLILLYGLE